MNCSKKRVVVIGAGAAGIAAATRLYENGIHDVLVLEAESRIGGRVYSRNTNDDDECIEMGAQWIHGEAKNVVFELASERDLFLRSNLRMDTGIMYARSNGEILEKDVCDTLDNVANTVRDNFTVTDLLHYDSSGSYYVAKFTDVFNEKDNNHIPEYLREEFIEYFHQSVNSYDGSDTWFDSAVSSMTEYRECEGCHYAMWNTGGYQTLFSILMEKCNEISNGAFRQQNIITDVEVKKINLDSLGVRLECTDGRTFTADHVIVTVSLGVLKEKYEKLFESVPLSEDKIRAILNLQIGTVDKIFLKFPHQWWPDDVNGLSLLWEHTARKKYEEQGSAWVTHVFVLNRVEHAPQVLCAWVCGPSARRMEQIDQTEVQRTLMQVLKEFFGARFEIPDPVGIFSKVVFLSIHETYEISSDIDKIFVICTVIAFLPTIITPLLVFSLLMNEEDKIFLKNYFKMRRTSGGRGSFELGENNFPNVAYISHPSAATITTDIDVQPDRSFSKGSKSRHLILEN